MFCFQGPHYDDFVQAIDKYGQFSSTGMKEKKSDITVIYANPLTTELLTDLFMGIRAKEAAHIDDVLEMLKVVKE